MSQSNRMGTTPADATEAGTDSSGAPAGDASADQEVAPGWVAVLFPNGEPLVYALSIADERYATQWTVYRGPREGDLHGIEFFLELDPVAMGLGGELVRQRSVLLCNGALDPVHYLSEAGGTRWEVRFESAEVTATLPDGSEQVVPRGEAQFIAADNVPGHKALIFAALACRKLLDQEVTVGLFLANQLAAVPYQMSPALDLAAESGTWHRSSHLEEIHLDEHGLMIEGMVPTQGVRGWLERPGPPVPQWLDEAQPVTVPLRYHYRDNTRFRLEDVTIPGPVTPIGATLSIPEGPGPFPAVLFLSGSGTHDRHGIAGEIDMGTHEIMDFLAEQGLLGLRFDSRGAGTTKMGEDTLVRGLDSEIADARACLEFLRARPEAAGGAVFLLGHSQGGTVALVLAEQEGIALRGVVLMATMGRSIEDVITDQIVYMGKDIGLTDEQIEQQIQEVQEAVELVKADHPWNPDNIPHYLLAMFRSPTWLKQLLLYRTVELITRLQCPLLVCQGSKDFQVSAERDAELLVTAAQSAGGDCTYALFPNLDHLFKATAGESTMAQYFDQTRHVDPEFLQRVAAWLSEHAS